MNGVHDWNTRLHTIDTLPEDTTYPIGIPKNTTLIKYSAMPREKKSKLRPPMAVNILDSIVADLCIRDLKFEVQDDHPLNFEDIADNLAPVPQMRLYDAIKDSSIKSWHPRNLSKTFKGFVGKFYERDENYVTAYNSL
ncbi:hypothetical protein AKO1_013990 [Acrasis kona]|uniref:Uncharacterized protein n=1 Tax=Acrasis kona TaxID=1008807 RepID=A0AAW2Z325_9EUKA